MPHVQRVTKRDQFKKLISQEKLTVLMYYTTWCYYCKLFHPTFDQLVARKEFAGIQFCKIDCTADTKDVEEITERGKADGYPHVAVFRGNRLLTKKSGNNELDTMKRWLGDCIVASKVSSPSAQHKKPSKHLEELHHMKKGDEPLVTQLSDFDDVYSLANEHKHVIVGFYKKARPNASRSLWTAFKQAVAKAEFSDVRWVSFACDDDEDTSDDWLLDYQSHCWFFRDGVMFCEWKGIGTDSSCEQWLSDCLVASSIADTAPAAHYSDGEEEDSSEQEAEGTEETNADVEGAEIGLESTQEEGLQETVTEESSVEARKEGDEGQDDADAKSEDGWEDEDDESGEEEEEDEEEEDEEEEEEEDDSSLAYISTPEKWQEKLSDHKTVVVTFYDPWNPYAQASLVVLEGVATSEVYPTLAFCAVSREDDLAENLRNIHCPEIRILRDGTEVTKVDCVLEYDNFKKWIEEYVEDATQPRAEEPPAEEESETAPDNKESDESTSPVSDGPSQQSADRLSSPSPHTSHTSDPPLTELEQLHLEENQDPAPKPMDETSASSASNDDTSEQQPSVVISPVPIVSPTPAVAISNSTTILQVENHSTTSLTSVATSSTVTMHSLPPCTGLHIDRPKSRLRFLGRRKPFHDPEPGCVFVPTEDGEGLQIGRANEGASYFNITLSHTHAHDDVSKTQMSFGLGFGPDPTERDRFVSAVFRVTFGYDDEHGAHQHLKIKNLSPQDAKGESTEVKWGRGSEGSLSLSLGYSSVSLGGESKRSKNAEYVRKTSSRVRGQGVHTPTAEWTFEEDEGEAGRHGLDPQYELSVTLPDSAAHRVVWMEFWGKAVLARGRSLTGLDVTLKIGDEDEPYRRNLDLNSGVSTAR